MKLKQLYFSKASIKKLIIPFIILLIGLFLLIIIIFTFPIRDLPRPTGIYNVGVKEFVLVDYNRNEQLSENPKDPRTILVKVWYPAGKVAGLKREKYADKNNLLGKSIAKLLGAPEFLFGNLPYVSTNSYPEAPIAASNEKFPLVFYSHGSNSFVGQNTIQMEELASYGYVVLGISHTYEAAVTIFPDGKAVPCNIKKIRQMDDIEINNRKSQFLKAEIFKDSGLNPIAIDKAMILAFAKSKNDYLPQKNRNIIMNTLFKKKIKGLSAGAKRQYIEEKLKLIKEMADLDNQYYFREPFNTRVADVRFVLTEFLKSCANPGSLFHKKVDPKRIGVFGHSYGGATAERVCLLDSRFAAGINMDGTQQGFMERKNISKPFLNLYSEKRKTFAEYYEKLGFTNLYNIIFKNPKKDVFELTIHKTEHFDYTDLKYLVPILKYTGRLGVISSQEMIGIENRCIVQFFNKYLKKKGVSLSEQYKFGEKVSFKHI